MREEVAGEEVNADGNEDQAKSPGPFGAVHLDGPLAGFAERVADAFCPVPVIPRVLAGIRRNNNPGDDVGRHAESAK